MGADRFLSSRGVVERSFLKDATEGDLEADGLLGVDVRVRDNLEGDREGDESSRMLLATRAGTETLTFHLPMLLLTLDALSLFGVLGFCHWLGVSSLASTDGRGISGSLSIG